MPASLGAWFRGQPAYKTAEALLRDVHGLAQREATRLNGASIKAAADLRKAIEETKDKPDLPVLELTPKITATEAADVVFDSRDDFVTATRKLQTIK